MILQQKIFKNMFSNLFSSQKVYLQIQSHIFTIHLILRWTVQGSWTSLKIPKLSTKTIQKLSTFHNKIFLTVSKMRKKI